MEGTKFVGSFTYDTAATAIADANSRSYPDSATISMQTAVGSTQTAPGGATVQSFWDIGVGLITSNDIVPADLFSVRSVATFSGALSDFAEVGLWFVDGTGGTPDDPLGVNQSPLPEGLLLSDFDAAELFILGPNANFYAAGIISCLSTRSSACVLSTIPEPGTLALLGLGLLGLALARRRRAN